MPNIRCLAALVLLSSTHAVAAPPGTDIWLVELAAGEISVASAARNITARPGYDNQPAFITSHSLLFTSMDASGQADAWRLDLATGKAAPLIVTPESEYSPTPAPGGALSVVRVDARNVQQLALLAPGGREYELLFPLLEGIGYHAWLDERHVALYMVRDPSELHVANRESGEVAILAKDIGRCLQPVPGAAGSIAFVEPGADGARWIKRLDLAERRITSIAPVIEDSEDFALLPDGRLLMASGRVLFAWADGAWRELARFDSLPGEITRLAVSPDGRRLAMVVNEGTGS